MSFSTKVVTTYAKSLFQNINNPQLSKRNDESFKLSTSSYYIYVI